jgi:hypothetical protein
MLRLFRKDILEHLEHWRKVRKSDWELSLVVLTAPCGCSLEFNENEMFSRRCEHNFYYKLVDGILYEEVVGKPKTLKKVEGCACSFCIDYF